GFRLSETPHEVRRAAPLLGEHTFEVATEILGLDPDEVGRLVAEEVLY
ncbi:MAG: CoA transferase, partial [Dehalococcoidia bacterium]|nr:CoA transferase [Dehalococcoidia bacterium]